MIKKCIKRALLGFIWDVFAIYLITILTSINIGNGEYHAVNSLFIRACNTELGAVLMQFVIAGGLGIVFGGSTIVWEIDKWSLAKQTVVHFFIVTTALILSAYICNLIHHTVASVLLWILHFVVVYVVIWFICYSGYKRKVASINKTLKEKAENK